VKDAAMVLTILTKIWIASAAIGNRLNPRRRIRHAEFANMNAL
jgi:hypothetical protein